jgi:hypothetical protein
MADRLGVSRFQADIDVITSVSAREPTDFEQEALASGDGLSAFEPGPNGEAPALRIRRIGPGREPETSADLKLIVADRLRAFQPSWGPDARRLDGSDPWETRLLFYESPPEIIDYHVRMGERPDSLSAAVSLAVARAANRETALRETYYFDPAIIEPVLRSQQARAQWLVLVSRHPAYRAVQACTDAVTLLDFKSRIEAGRPVHISVSIGKDRHDQCVDALARTCSKVLRGQLVSADVLLKRARLLAPGLALQALGSQDTALEGLIGLLLTATEMGATGRLVLSLDQHRPLLSGSGILADLI